MSSEPTRPSTAVVIKSYKAAYPEPLLLKNDDEVKILKAPAKWPGWLWCEALNGEKRWVPIEFLTVSESTGILNRAYDTTELSVELDEGLTVLEITAGWAWCQKSDSTLGWVPFKHLKMS